jgi:adenylate cyclase
MYSAKGRHEDALAIGRRLIELDDLREDTHRLLIRCYLSAGRRSEALRQYGLCRDILNREIGVEPAPETKALAEEIRGEAARPRSPRDYSSNLVAEPSLTSSKAADSANAVGHVAERLQERQLLLIAFLDLVEYSELASEDKEGTLRRWNEMTNELIEPSINEGGGRLVHRWGDGTLCTFQSALHGVKWALELQSRIQKTEQAKQHNRPLWVRIAVHLGDVVLEDGTSVVGDGVNVAARLQEHAPPGGVVISEPVHELVSPLIKYEAEDLGPLAFKNIERSVRAFSVTTDALTHVRRPAALPSHRPSVALMPFRSVGPEPIEPYFIEGLCHGIVASLATFRELFVISANSTLNLKGEALEASRRLKVRYVLTGTAAKLKEQIRLEVELTDAETNSIVWSDLYLTSTRDLFAAQDTAATRIAYSLLPHLRRSELGHALRKTPTNMDAYDFVLQALHRLYLFESADHQEAFRLLNKAVERDPNYSMAYALLAHWYELEIGEGRSHDEEKDRLQSERYSLLALSLDPFDSLALAIHGHCTAFLSRALDRAVSIFDRALACSSNSPIAWGMSSPTYSYIGDGPLAIARAEYALRLSPLDPYIHIFHAFLGLAHYVNGTHEDAVHWSRRALSTSPRFTAAMRHLIGSLVILGRREEASQVAAQLLSIRPQFRVRSFIDSYPIKDAERAVAYANQLLAAGLPE